MSAIDPEKLAQARALFGIPPAASKMPEVVLMKAPKTAMDAEVVLVKGQPKTINIDLDTEMEEEISLESIIRDKPPTREVREFFRDNLMELEDSD